MTVSGESITSKYLADADAVSLAMANSQPIESIGQRRPSAVPKNATRTPADMVPWATSRMPSTSAMPNAISGRAMITAQSTEMTRAFLSSVSRRSRACRRNNSPR